MQNNFNLIDATTHKIQEKIESLAHIKKEIINYTNNFREFKLLKSDIIQQFLESENDFRQLNIILKSVTNQNTIQKNSIENLTSTLEKNENQIKLLEKENLESKKIIEDFQNKNNLLNNSNSEKDIFIHDLLGKIFFLENVIKDYHKRYFILKYDKMFSYISPFKNEELIRKFYEKFIPIEYKSLNNPVYSNFFKNIYTGFEEEEKISPEKNKRTNLKNIEKNKEKSSSKKLFESYYNKKFSPLNNLVKTEEENKNNYMNNNMPEKNPFLSTTYKQNAQNKNEFLNQENYENNLYENNNKNFNNDNNIISNNFQISPNSDMIKDSNGFSIPSGKDNKNNKLRISAEKEKATHISDLLLKIFSSKIINKTLKRKFGDNFQIKLTDKESDPNFIELVENEVDYLIEKDLEKEQNIRERLNSNRTRKNRISSISPKYFDNSKENRFKKTFNNFTKNYSDYFDPKLQYGGDTCVPNSARNFSVTKSLDRYSNKRTEIKNRLSDDMNNKMYGFQQGWNNLNEFFTSTNNFEKMERSQQKI